jgi:hypothetical protein
MHSILQIWSVHECNFNFSENIVIKIYLWNTVWEMLHWGRFRLF